MNQDLDAKESIFLINLLSLLSNSYRHNNIILLILILKYKSMVQLDKSVKIKRLAIKIKLLFFFK